MRRVAAVMAIVLSIALVYWPGLYGFWTRDDYMQLAFARLVGSPWPPFVHDHYFPVPGSIFRPLGFASFWLSQALFGADYFRSAFGDLALHIAVALALYRVVRIGGVERAAALLFALLFALHPAVLGTALWWSARFDVLALLFALLAIGAALDHAKHARAISLFTALAALVLALLSKETALAAAAAIGFVWLRAARRDPSVRNRMLAALVAWAAIVALFFAWRTAMLGTMTTGLAGQASLLDAFGRGIARWFANLAGYATYWSRVDATIIRVLLPTALAVGVAGVWMAFAKRDDAKPYSQRVDLLLCGLCLFAFPAVLQAPVAGMNATPLGSGAASAVEAAMQSRLYYVSFGGLAIACAAVFGDAWSRAGTPRALLTVALATMVVMFGWISRGTAVAFAAETAASRSMAEAVAAAVDRSAASAGPRCGIVVLGVEPPPEWSIYVSVDSVAKALSTDLDRVGRCFIHADYVTYFNLMRGDVDPADAKPYAPHEVEGRPLAWLRIGAMTVAYLDPPPTTDATALEGLVFLRYRNGAFVDMTTKVVGGRLPVVLR
jgi:hypothetical protein